MPYVYISGKPVFAQDDQELRRLLPLADTAPPEHHAVTSPKPEARPQPASPAAVSPQVPMGRLGDLRGVLSSEDPKTQALLRLLATYYPKPAPGEELKAKLGFDSRVLAGVGVRLSRRFGKGNVMKVSIERHGRKRAYQYKLCPAVATIAKEEGWE